MNKANKYKRWLIIPSSTFCDNVDNKCILLYNTTNGRYVTSGDPKFINLINLLFEPKNHGCIVYETIQGTEYYPIISKALKIEVLQIVNANERPFILLPIYNLQRDLEKNLEVGIDKRMSLIEKKLRFLTGINIWLIPLSYTDSDRDKIAYRNYYYRQHCTPIYENNCRSCFFGNDFLKKVLDELQYSGVSNVNLILGKDLFNTITPNSFLEILCQYNFSYTISCFYEDLHSIFNKLEEFATKRIRYQSYVDKYNINNYINYSKKYSLKNTSLYYLVSCEDELNAVDENTLMLLPVMTEDNVLFFKKNVLMTIDDIKDHILQHEHIFRNMKLNSNFFGILDIDFTGKITAHGSNYVLGNLMNGSTLLQATYKELKDNHTWRLTRKLTSCNTCPFRFICPPISCWEVDGALNSDCEIKNKLGVV